MIADGKRGDIDVTAAAYAASLFGGLDSPFGALRGLGADLATVNPLMGLDAVQPFVDAARAAGAGVLLLVRTSNPGARDVEDLPLAGDGGERTVGSGSRGSCTSSAPTASASTGLSDVGAVIGASEPAHLVRARELMPDAPFLLPGVGAQGGRVDELAAGLRARARRRAGQRLAQHRRSPPGRGGEPRRCRARAPPSACASRRLRSPSNPRGRARATALACGVRAKRIGGMGDYERRVAQQR